MSDEVTVELPAGRDFYRIAHLVLGGLAIRLDLTYEQLEDLQLALASVLSDQEAGDVTVSLLVEEHAIRMSVGPFPEGRLHAAVEVSDGERLDLRRLLETICDEVSVVKRGDVDWIELRKNVEGVASA